MRGKDLELKGGSADLQQGVPIVVETRPIWQHVLVILVALGFIWWSTVLEILEGPLSGLGSLGPPILMAGGVFLVPVTFLQILFVVFHGPALVTGFGDRLEVTNYYRWVSHQPKILRGDLVRVELVPGAPPQPWWVAYQVCAIEFVLDRETLKVKGYFPWINEDYAERFDAWQSALEAARNPEDLD